MAERSNEELYKKIEDIERKLLKSATPTAQRPDPVQAMKDAGFGVFTKEGQNALGTIKDKYNGDFKRFFTELSIKYDFKNASAERKKLGAVLSTINSLSLAIDRLLESKDMEGSIKDIEYVREYMRKLDSDMDFFTNSSELTGVMSKNIEDVEASTDVSLAKLREAQGLFGRKAQQITKPKVSMPGVRKVGRALGEYAKTAIFTPFEPALRDISALDKERTANKETLENAKFEKAGINTANEGSAAGPFFAPSREAIGIGATGIGATVAGSSTQRGGGSNIQNDLFAFFNSKAYQAKWTKELLEAVGGGSRSKSDTEKASQSAGMGFAGELSKLMAPAIGILFAAQAGWMVGKMLGEVKIGGKTINQHVEGGFTKLLGGDEKDQLKKQAAKAERPEMKRALELQLQGMPMKDAVAQANAELGIGGDKKESPSVSIKDKVDKISIKDEGGKKGIATPADMLHDPEFGELDPVTGLPLDKSKMGAYQKKEQDKMWGRTEISEGSKSKVPIDTIQGDVQKLQKEGTDKLNSVIKEMSDSVKDLGKGSAKPRPSGYDANNTRNPILSSIGAGQLTS